MANGPLLFGALVSLTVLCMFLAVRANVQSRDAVEARLAQYGVTGELAAADESGKRRRSWRGVNRLLDGFGLGTRLAGQLARAGMPLTAAEYALIVVAAAAVGLAVGLWRGSALGGVALAGLGGAVPLVYLRMRQARRIQAFTMQLPDVLTLLIGALRAGHGLGQAINMVAEQVPDPASVELGRVMRGVNFGLSVQRALSDMAARVGSDDLDLVVTAMSVQYEMGGDLAETLNTIAETVRDRIRMKREIQSLTAQQRFTGYVLAGLPLFMGVAIYLISPANMVKMFQPGRIFIPIATLVLMAIGFLVIRKIVDIEV